MKTNVPQKTFSSFWPLLIVFLSILAIQSFHLKSAWEQNEQLKVALNNMTDPVKQAVQIDQTIEGLGKDLYSMKDSNAAANEIVTNLGIRLNASVPAPEATQK
jgi:hypothetical protein